MKLNLGSRTTDIEGFKNVDCYGGDNVDFACDLGSLTFAKDGKVDEIYASHCLEHFPHTKTLDVLKEWNRVLKKGGKLYVAVPDWEAILKVYRTTGLLSDWIVNMLYGDQIYDKAFHYTVFNYPRLMNILYEAGFERVNKIKEMPYGIRDCSKQISNVTNEPISLNVEAVK